MISIAAYTAAFEEYDYSMASAIAMIMGAVQLIIVVAVLAVRGAFYRGPPAGQRRERCALLVPRRSFGDRLWSTAMAVLITFFVVNVFGIIASVVILVLL